MGKKLELAIGFLNGAVGDYLARTGNGLATSLTLAHEGVPVPVDRATLARLHPGAPATGRVVVLVHGLMCTESIFDFTDGSGDYGAFLERDLGLAPLYVRYNSGLPIADNGAALSTLLDALVAAYPVPLTEIVLLGFSMGGLVARAACHVAATAAQPSSWLPLVRRALYCGTPHRGAPLERYGRVLAKLLNTIDDPYTQLFGQLSDLRSDGVKDLGDADLRHEDRARRVARIALRDPEHPVPLLPQIRHYLVAAHFARDPWLIALFGDTIVPLGSATNGVTPLPQDHVHVIPGMHHVGLAHDARVYQQLLAWLREDGA
jgi:pimeloyl-ACP methyl ester carboxylesterase